MLWWAPRSFDSRFVFPTIVGVLAGMALLTKSFAQLVPIGVGLAWWHLIERGWNVRAFVRRSAPGLAWVAVLSLAMFGLWFALDPEPAAIWREFVLGENVGKMGSAGFAGWLRDLVWGGSSVWTLFAGWFVNAGLLAFPLFGVMVECWKHRATLHRGERMLWAWVFAIFIVFCLPSQRSERYLLEAMPALATLMALRSHHVGRNAFMITLAVAACVFLGVGWVSLSLVREVGVTAIAWWHWPLVLGGAAIAITAMLKPSWTVPCTAPVAMGVFLAISSFLSVFDAPLGTFDAAAQGAVAGRMVWVPEDFRSVAEMDRFLLPNAVVRGYPQQWGVPPAELRDANDFVMVVTPIDAPAPQGAVGGRIELTGRHTGEQIRQMVLGDVRRHLFCREWLVPAATLPVK
jgi:branched-subunit amino acid transport protein AzlD